MPGSEEVGEFGVVQTDHGDPRDDAREHGGGAGIGTELDEFGVERGGGRLGDAVEEQGCFKGDASLRVAAGSVDDVHGGRIGVRAAALVGRRPAGA